MVEAISVFTYIFSKIIPKKKNRWIFGAWFGTAVSDNSKAISDYVEKNFPEIEMVWITNKPEELKLKHGLAVKRNSMKSLRYILTAQVAVMNQGFGDFNAYNFLGGVYKVQLWHGVAWKKIVGDALPENYGIRSKIYRKLFFFINHYDLYIAPSEIYSKTIESAFQTTPDKIMKVGQPRNAVLFDAERCIQCRNNILDKIKAGDKKIIVYMPTFRDKSNESFSFANKSIIMKIAEIAEKFNFVIVEKSHFEDKRRNNNERHKEQFVHVLPDEPADVLLSAADILITDYSSCFFDYLIRNKPIIHFAYDYEYYRDKDRGLYYELDEVAAGSVAYNVEDLYEAIKRNLENENHTRQRRNMIKEKFITYESCNSCEKIVERIISEIS